MQHVHLRELFVRRGFRWKLIHGSKFDTLDEPDDNEKTDDVPRDPKSLTLIT